VQEESVRCGGDGVGDPWSESEERLQAGQAIDAHAEVDDDEIGILRERSTVWRLTFMDVARALSNSFCHSGVVFDHGAGGAK